MSGPEVFDRIHVQSMFPTPFAITRLAHGKRINPGLRTYLLGLAEADARDEDQQGAAWRAKVDIAMAEDGVRMVADAAQALATRLVADRAGHPVEISWRLRAEGWLLRRGYRIEPQVSPAAFWTALYFVDDGGTSAEPALGASLLIDDPRPATRMQLAKFSYNMPGGLSAGQAEVLQPAAGMLALFPAWLGWQVRPYSGTGTWACLSFALTPEN